MKIIALVDVDGAAVMSDIEIIDGDKYKMPHINTRYKIAAVTDDEMVYAIDENGEGRIALGFEIGGEKISPK